MKLQNLIIIFLIIIIPIVFIFSLYLKLETKTITLQTDYDGKLVEAAKEAMEAFEINTTEWNSDYSSLANKKRNNIMSSINVFTTSLADKLRIGGTTQETILTYVPAIIFTMYDGYYIYTPTYVPQTITNNNGVQLFYYGDSGPEGTKITASATQNIGGTIFSGEPIYYAKTGEGTLGTYSGEDIYYTTDVTKAEKIYKHVLKTFVPYTTIYGDYVVNYTLDNYIRIYGEIQSKEGYVIGGFGTTNIIYIPQNSILGITYNGKTIEPETLTENIYVRENVCEQAQLKTYPYIYNSNNDKRYYEAASGKFFMLDDDYVKVFLPEVEIGSSLAEYKKVLVCPNDTSYNWDYLELYQLINGSNNNWYYKDSNGQYIIYDYSDDLNSSINRGEDCSAINYYVETCEFNHWLTENSIDIDAIMELKRDAIIDNINENLNLSISNYSANSNIDYQIPELSDADWDQSLSNISMIVFLQGQKIGLKTYNNYAIVTSIENNEYVSEDSLYYLDNEDDYYHRFGCSTIANNTSWEGIHRNTEFKVKNYNYLIDTNGDGRLSEETDQKMSGHYYKHTKTSLENVQQCFDCIVNRNNLTEDQAKTNLYEKSFYTALARERYVQM